MGVSSPAQSTPLTPRSTPAQSIIGAVPHLVVVLVVVVGVIILAAMKVVSAAAALGVLGVALGGSGTVAAAGLTPNG